MKTPKKAQNAMIDSDSTTQTGEDAASQTAETKQAEPNRKSMGKKAIQKATAASVEREPALGPAVSRDVLFEKLPQVSCVAGAALQADIMELNRSVIRLLQTAARLGPAEPLAPMLLGTSSEMIDLFLDPGRGERLLAQSIGFPLVQLRIHDVGVMRQMLSEGLVSASSVQGITRSFPLEVLEVATRR